MVRRWSYINSLNTRTKFSTSTWLSIYSQQTAKDTIYLRHKLSNITFNLRTKVSRRKHLNQWLFYTNILADWSNEYLLLKQYARSTYNFKNFKYNFIAINLILNLKQHNRTNDALKLLIKASLTRKWVGYFNKKYTSFASIYKYILNTNLVYLSSPKSLTLKEASVTKTGITHHVTSSSLVPVTAVTNVQSAILGTISSFIFIKNMSCIKEYYKIILLLTYSKLNNFVFKKNLRYLQCFKRLV